MTHYAKGQWNAVCDRCGFKFKSSKMRKEWTGLMVCSGAATNDCWEPQHPQENKTGRVDRQATAWTRGEAPDVFLAPGDVTAEDL